MKRILFVLLLISSLLACRDEEAIRIPDFQDAPNVRVVIEPAFSYFDFSNLAAAKLRYDIYSENYDQIEEVEFSFRYQRNGAPACNLYGCLGPFVVKTYTAEELSASRGQILDEEITIDEVLALIGLELDDISGGDQFFFVNKTTMKDGRVYPTAVPGNQDNIPAIFDTPGAHYTASWAAIVGCPVADPFTGSYALTQISGPENWNGGGAGSTIFASGNVTLTAVNPITRTFTCSYLGFTGRPFTFILLCEDVIVPLQSAGLSCGGPNMAWQTSATPASYDPSDDSVIDIFILENPLLGCGQPSTPTVLRLTKN